MHHLWCIRSSHQRGSMKNGVLRNFAKFIGKHLCQIQSLRPATLLKKKFWHRCFPVNFAKSLRTPFLQNSSGRLLLYKKRSFMTGFKQAFDFDMCYIIYIVLKHFFWKVLKRRHEFQWNYGKSFRAFPTVFLKLQNYNSNGRRRIIIRAPSIS